MTDREKLIELLTSWGVGYAEGNNYIRCEQGTHARVGGYMGFLTEFEFDSNGKFIQLGAYE
jgi:hypothetical protein